jgi:nucleotide-binding universal stress UspA family protein
MTIRSIVSLFGGADHELTALAAALEIARANAGRLRIVHVVTPPHIYAGFYGEAAMAGAAWLESVERENRDRLATARQEAERLCKEHGIRLDAAASPAGQPGAVFVPVERSIKSALAKEISLCDLIVAGRDKGASDLPDESASGVALFATGRPLLFVPPAAEGGPAWRGKTAAVAWNASPEAMRAVVNAVALLEAAETVQILTAEDRRTAAAVESEAMLTDYLAAHGIAAKLTMLDSKSASPAEVVLRQARELGCDFLVMGAFGHSVFREMLLGGFTADVLESADLPLVLTH